MDCNRLNLSKISGSKFDECSNEYNSNVYKSGEKYVIGNSSKITQCEHDDRGNKHLEGKKGIHEWAGNTTFHGIRYVFDSNTSTLRRFVWFLLIAGMWIGLIRSCIVQYNRYFDYETVTQDTFRSENKIAFPAVTVCTQCEAYNISGRSDDLQILQQLKNVQSKEDIQILKAIYGSTFKENASTRELYESLSLPADVFINQCLWDRRTSSCSKDWKSTNFLRSHCFTFNSDIKEEKLMTSNVGRHNGGLSMTVFLSRDTCVEIFGSGIELAVHETGVDTNMFVSTNLAPGFHHSIGVTINEREFLPPPVTAFGTRECLDTERPGFTNPLKYFPKYSLYACEQECVVDYLLESCGCIATKYPENLKRCDALSENTCALPAYLVFWSDYNNNVDRCGCRERCKYTTYTTAVSSSYMIDNMIVPNPNITTEDQLNDKEFVRNNFLSFDVYLDSKVVHVTKQIRDFTLGDLGGNTNYFSTIGYFKVIIWLLEILMSVMGNREPVFRMNKLLSKNRNLPSIGGFFGLAIGASVLTFCEIFDMIFTLIGRKLRNLQRR